MPNDVALWDRLANFGFPALVTGFVLWRVDTKLSTLMEKINTILLLAFMQAKHDGLEINKDKLMSMLWSDK